MQFINKGWNVWLVDFGVLLRKLKSSDILINQSRMQKVKKTRSQKAEKTKCWKDEKAKSWKAEKKKSCNRQKVLSMKSLVGGRC